MTGIQGGERQPVCQRCGSKQQIQTGARFTNAFGHRFDFARDVRDRLIHRQNDSRVQDSGLGPTDEIQDLFGAFGVEESLSERGVAQESSQEREDLEMLGDGGGDEKEEETDGLMIDGIERNADRMSPEDDGGMFDQAGECGSGMGQCDAVADARAVEIFPFPEGLEQRATGFGPAGEFRKGKGELLEDIVPMLAGEMELDGGWRKELGDADRGGFRWGHGLVRGKGARSGGGVLLLTGVEGKCSALPRGMGTR